MNNFGDKEFRFSPKDFKEVKKRLYALSGIKLSDSKDSMVYSRLARRLRALKISSFKEYLAFVEHDAQEVERFVNALTTNLTSFFRESHHFDILKEHLQKNRRSMTIWCAASSTGEEPYSIAMTVVEALGTFNAPVKIIASDIDSQVLATARMGIYPLKMVESLSHEKRKHFFHRGKGAKLGKVRVVPELQNMVTFKKINLMDQVWDIPDSLDVIFCRNVMIYFDKPTQLRLIKKMVSRMPDNGLYFAGHSENFSHVSDVLIPLGRTVYRPNKE